MKGMQSAKIKGDCQDKFASRECEEVETNKSYNRLGVFIRCEFEERRLRLLTIEIMANRSSTFRGRSLTWYQFHFLMDRAISAGDRISSPFQGL